MVTDNAEAVENTEEMSVYHTSKQDTVVESKDDFQSKEQLVISKLNKNTSHQVNMMESKDEFLTKQQHVLETIQQSILDLKQETMRSKIEGDVRARDFQHKQQHDLELVKQSFFDLKQSVVSSRGESAHQVDMVERNDNFQSKEQSVLENTHQSCLVKDGAKKKVTKYNKIADEEKLMQIFRDHGYPTD